MQRYFLVMDYLSSSLAAKVNLLLCCLLCVYSVPTIADENSIASDPDDLVVTANRAYIDVYSGPGRGYPIFHVLEHGEQIILRHSRTSWINVQTKRGKRGKRGWVKRDDMRYMLGPDGLVPDFVDTLRSDAVVNHFELGVKLGDFGGADAVGATLGYRFTRNLTAELRYSVNTGQFSNSEIMAVGLLHQPFPEWRLSPFFSVGAGTILINPNATLVATEDREDSILQATVGTYLYLSRRFFLRAEYTNNYMLTTRESNEEVNGWKLGFNVFF